MTKRRGGNSKSTKDAAHKQTNHRNKNLNAEKMVRNSRDFPFRRDPDLSLTQHHCTQPGYRTSRTILQINTFILSITRYQPPLQRQ
ncbi:unnamed protein product [Callosobruchus maculatus]|uniref:Uncharacterized protein n=1 Tax=Callosobruchus maculatus TaxID=64391 RepID=A0A653CSH5_CALMS|nr:unnamed protein product [Callosobruchus maculatus]